MIQWYFIYYYLYFGYRKLLAGLRFSYIEPFSQLMSSCTRYQQIMYVEPHVPLVALEVVVKHRVYPREPIICQENSEIRGNPILNNKICQLLFDVIRHHHTYIMQTLDRNSSNFSHPSFIKTTPNIIKNYPLISREGP